jgi:hypothetical protein
MKPVHQAGDFRQPTPDEISTLEVRQLVSQHLIELVAIESECETSRQYESPSQPAADKRPYAAV